MKATVKGARAALHRSLTLALDLEDGELALAVGNAARDRDNPASWGELLTTLAERAGEEAKGRASVFDADFDGEPDAPAKAARLLKGYAGAIVAVASVVERLTAAPGARP
ncbi:MAG TPA: hypothetical protein VFS43_00180 [Polyangiaceae bacterium]|nr:hypothetical protein [Polyangiaceae bacterium]